MASPDLSIVILSWNTRELLRECLQSVVAEPTGLLLEVFVADNGSTDGSVGMVRELFPQIEVVENGENLGFAVANNRIFPLCRSPIVMLLNSDTIVMGAALRVLAEYLRSHQTVGAVGPRLLHPQAQLRVLGCGRLPTLRTHFNHNLFLAALLPGVRVFEGLHYYVGVHDDRARAVDWVSGACLVVRREVVDEVGPMSERWFMYAEDLEWCARIQRAGWEIHHVPEAVVEHHLGGSTAASLESASKGFAAGRDLFVLLNRPNVSELRAYDLVAFIGYLLRSGGYFLRSLLDRSRSPLWHSRSAFFRQGAQAALKSLISRDSSARSGQAS